MISAVGLRKSFGTTRVLEGVDLQLGPGQCLVLLGPNGAGKTTLLRILATLCRPSAGSLTVAGVDALRSPEVARGAIGMAGHGSYVYEDLTAVENLRFWTALCGHDGSPGRVRAALAAVELDGVADERARTFSAGMKRRLGLARILLGEARVLLLDEPWSGLDRQGQKWLAGFLGGVRERGGTVVLATHSFGAGLAAADRVAILADGRLVLDRPARAIGREDLRSLYDSFTEGTPDPAP
ncbi:MAG: heme ABC exporter ATP-binding protein CcmA [Candidatus Rokubacteria bacterium]|nr:heme ABC exporter ATP-binding protein CcmA [Candidatus Rokubacteria bacterium]